MRKTVDLRPQIADLRPQIAWFRLFSLFVIHYLLVIIVPLFAQQLRLPTEEIIGSITDTPDSLGIHKDYSDHYLVTGVERLAYRTVYEKEIDLRKKRSQNGYFYLRGNHTMSPLFDAQFGAFSRDLPLFNIHGKGYYADQDSFSTLKGELHWKPQTYLTDWRLRPEGFFKFSSHKADSYRIDSSDMFILGVTAGAYPTDIKGLKALRASASYLNYNQTGEDDVNDIESDVTFHFGEYLFTAESKWDWYFRYGSGHFTSNIYFPFSFFNVFALNMQYSDSFWASLLLEKSFYIDEKVELAVSNFPYIETISLYDYNDSFAYAPLKNIKYTPQVPLNAFLAFNLYMPLETRVYFNSKYIQNYNYVQTALDSIVTATDTLRVIKYNWRNEDAFINSINLELKYIHKGFTIGLDTKYQLSDLTTVKDDKKVPYEPHLQITPSMAYTYKKYTGKLKIDCLLLRYDSTGEDMDNVVIGSIENTFDINDHFKFSLNLNNFFNQDYYRIKGLPSEKFNAELALRVLF